jgi:DNA-binding transcriptional regulator YhcF (GntR family)
MAARRITKAGLAEQLAAHYRQMIRAGRLKPGSELPSVRDLARQEEISVSTVWRAFRTLRDEGWIVSHQGAASVVAEHPPTS